MKLRLISLQTVLGRFIQWDSCFADRICVIMSTNEELIQCPYNVTHMIIKPRMASHLIKCRQQYPVEKYVTCPLNSTHDIPEPELEYHVKTCPDRCTVEKSIYIMEEPKPIDQRTLEIEVPDCSENWDEEKYPGSSYLKVKEDIIQRNMVLRQPIGRTKSERKAFLQNEIRRFGLDASQNCADQL